MVDATDYGSSGSSIDNLPNANVYMLPMDPEFEIPARSIRICERLGEGAFGAVFRARLRGLPRRRDVVGGIEAAVKTLKDGLPDCEVEDFLQEIQVMKYIGSHPNVVQLYATSTQHGRPLMVMEYAARGSLLHYLRENRNSFLQASTQRETTFPQFCRQVATGMEYLASKGVGFFFPTYEGPIPMIVHRDLAARNVVVTSDGVLKITDFGLTRIVRVYYRMTRNVSLRQEKKSSFFCNLFR
ncbi:unnamed protein product [Dibothriocephalus latus]|uniref:Protein kinase domain-containing protein n=1 Tax=Dibothriocephalus latus TaxID=60516 RepID=A0A3P7KWP9_DIBLA|nr:unnamed protein product [Dibothriocephalus latus]